MKIAPSVYFLGVFGLVTYVESTYYCSGSGDPCTQASTLFENYARTENCKHDGVHSPCDRYITPGWYVTDNPILDQCPDLLSCGAVYPVWFNGSLPTSGDGIVTEKLCKTGFFDCCTRTYDIQIKNCGTHYVYCLPALDACPERICFGTNGSCEYPTTTTPTTTSTIPTTTTESKYVPSKDYNERKNKNERCDKAKLRFLVMNSSGHRPLLKAILPLSCISSPVINTTNQDTQFI
ncbi:uromodulin-like isoform X4 [Ostrea edulis]|uniref:uromodulin-like isoform X4 n=1 Tax=Ostrea edulis TaxID=37623 RepID=UPI0024AF9F7A|nr:uromodulin-like isoform X4 [Ostrea edulis]